ncbi:MAG: dipeptide epimerase, partial [Myxococcota bacterium]
VELSDGLGSSGWGEAVPYPRYGESTTTALRDAVAAGDRLAAGAPWGKLAETLPPGAVRNALDLAHWDLRSRREGRGLDRILNRPMAPTLTTAFTISVDRPESMARSASAAAHRPLLKVKLNGEPLDGARLAAVRDAAPNAELIVDANESWTEAHYLDMLPHLDRVTLLEQPFPAGRDGALATLPRPVPVCADESCHGAADLEALQPCYDAINVKLDKTGGLTAALDLVARARTRQLEVMVGCMVCTSLAVAPTFLFGRDARWFDIDGPLLLTTDRPGGVKEWAPGQLTPPSIWGRAS